MCANYRPSSREILLSQFQVDSASEYVAEAWPGSFAPIIYLNAGERVTSVARFGLLPPFAKDATFARHTYNARSETVAEKPSFRNAWKAGRFCLVPAHVLYEPCYESGKAIRWAIKRADGGDFAVAGIWANWKNPATSAYESSFTMLTLNADDHPLMRRFHKPEDEKRMVYVVQPDEYDAWLNATPEQARTMIEPFAAEMMTSEAAPLIRARKSTPA